MARERTCAKIALRSSSAATVATIARWKCPSHRSASAGVIGRPSWRVSQARVGLLAVTTRAAQPLSKEQLLHRPAVRDVAREQRAQLIVVPDPLVQQVNQPVDRRLAADPLEQISTTESPETRRMIQQAAVLKERRMRRVRPGPVRRRGGAGTGRDLPAEGGRVLFPCASCGACLLPRGGLLLRHGCVRLRRDPAHPADERACLPDSGSSRAPRDLDRRCHRAAQAQTAAADGVRIMP